MFKTLKITVILYIKSFTKREGFSRVHKTLKKKKLISFPDFQAVTKVIDVQRTRTSFSVYSVQQYVVYVLRMYKVKTLQLTVPQAFQVHENHSGVKAPAKSRPGILHNLPRDVPVALVLHKAQCRIRREIPAV